MKRLIRKAWDSIELYHFTSSQLFMKIMEDGQITSGSYNNITSNGSHVEVYDLPSNNSEDNRMKTIEFLLDAQSSDSVFSKELSDYIAQKLNENNNESEEIEEIEVSITNPSYNEIGVYLTNQENDEEGYGFQSLDSNYDTNLPNFVVALKINVQTDALVPDYDDLDSKTEFSEGNPLWKQSLDRIGQVVHNGPIDANSITMVKIDDSDLKVGSPFGAYKSEITNWFSSKVTFNQWVTANEAFNQLSQLYQEYQNLDPSQL